MRRPVLPTVAVLLFAACAFAQAPPQAAAPLAAPTVTPASKPAQTPVRALSRTERKELTAKLAEVHRQFLLEVDPVINWVELDTFLQLDSDGQRETFIDDFWHRRDRERGTTGGTYRRDYYDRLQTVKEKFERVASDRGRMYLIYGVPDNYVQLKCPRRMRPMEIWTYADIPGLGHDVQFLFYLPLDHKEYVLWVPVGKNAVEDLVKTEAIFVGPRGSDGMPIAGDCNDIDQLVHAIRKMAGQAERMTRLLDPPQVNAEDATRIVRSLVIPNPNAARLAADFAGVSYPAKQGSRTDVEMTILVPRAPLTATEVGGTRTYSLDVTGEVLRDGQLFENFRYRYDFRADTKDETLPVVVDRFLRPADYKARVRVVDVNTGAEAIVERDLTVPEILDTPEQLRQKEAASSAVAAIKDAIESNEAQIRLVPLADDELVSGMQHIETMVVGEAIKGVEFSIDGRKLMVKRQPPYTLDLDLGDVPRARSIRAIGLGADGKPITGDELVVNSGSDSFRVRIVSPRVAINLRGKTRVQMDVRLPDGKSLDSVQLYFNETRVATLYDPPFVQTVNIPATEGVGYLRAVATLKDGAIPPVEDVVMVNTPLFMEEVNVHLVELPTTVITGGRPNNNLGEASFKIFDEGKPVKLAKFEHVKNLPLSIGMAFDTSGSMQPRIGEAQKAGGEFFQNVMKPGDKGFLVSFDSQAQLVQKWSSRVSDLHAGLSKLRAEESTALYDAIVYSLYNFHGVRGQKALVVITDGRDTSSKFTFDQALEYARRTGVPIYAIGIGISGPDIDVRYKLTRFCHETGGNIYYIENASDLHRTYAEIQDELRSQYILGFYPPEGIKPGSKWREVSVQTSEGKAKTVKGYYP
jgi:Ca-activated chloride channel family protein